MFRTAQTHLNAWKNRPDHQRLRKVFNALPLEVGRRFKYVRVDRETRSAPIAAALNQLCLARLAYKVHHSASNGLPLGAATRESVFKILCLDIGLMTSACGLSLQRFADEKECDLAVRFNSDQPSLAEATITYPGAHRASYRLVSLPFYLVEQVRRIVGEVA